MQASNVNIRRNRTVFEAGGSTVDGEPPMRRSRVNGTEADAFASPPEVISATKQSDAVFTSPKVGISAMPVNMTSSSQSHSGTSTVQSPFGFSNHSGASNSSNKRKRSIMMTKSFFELENSIDEKREREMLLERIRASEREIVLERERALEQRALERERVFERDRALERERASERERALERERARKAALNFITFGINDDSMEDI